MYPFDVPHSFGGLTALTGGRMVTLRLRERS